jgi:hypothetical protein
MRTRPATVPVHRGSSESQRLIHVGVLWEYARQPSRKELAATTLLALPLVDASVKIRTGPPDDGDGPDAALEVWAGQLPLASVWQTPVPDPLVPPAVPLPAHISGRVATRLH